MNYSFPHLATSQFYYQLPCSSTLLPSNFDQPLPYSREKGSELRSLYTPETLEEPMQEVSYASSTQRKRGGFISTYVSIPSVNFDDPIFAQTDQQQLPDPSPVVPFYPVNMDEVIRSEGEQVEAEQNRKQQFRDQILENPLEYYENIRKPVTTPERIFTEIPSQFHYQFHTKHHHQYLVQENQSSVKNANELDQFTNSASPFELTPQFHSRIQERFSNIYDCNTCESSPKTQVDNAWPNTFSTFNSMAQGKGQSNSQFVLSPAKMNVQGLSSEFSTPQLIQNSKEFSMLAKTKSSFSISNFEGMNKQLSNEAASSNQEGISFEPKTIEEVVKSAREQPANPTEESKGLIDLIQKLPLAYFPFQESVKSQVRMTDFQRFESVSKHLKGQAATVVEQIQRLLPIDFSCQFNVDPELLFENSYIMDGVRSNEAEMKGEAHPLNYKERREKVSKYIQKRQKRAQFIQIFQAAKSLSHQILLFMFMCVTLRVICRKVSYDVRKRVADSRLRVKGRFVTREQALLMIGETVENIDKYTTQELKELLMQKFGTEGASPSVGPEDYHFDSDLEEDDEDDEEEFKI